MNTFDFNRSFFTFRIDTLVKPPLAVTHKPPFSLNNARIPIECRCVVTEKATEIRDFRLSSSTEIDLSVKEVLVTIEAEDVASAFREVCSVQGVPFHE